MTDDSKDPVFDADDDSGREEDMSMTKLELWGLKLTIPKSLAKSKPEIDPLEVARKLLEDYGNQDNIEKTKSVVRIHRVLENTSARRRLEKWAKRVIVGYLLVVLSIVLGTYAHIKAIGIPVLHIPDNVMIAILTTTTANIIGLDS